MVTAVSLQKAEGAGDSLEDNIEVCPAKKAFGVRGHKGPVMAVAFSADGKLLATGGLDRTVRLWGLSNPPRELAHFDEPSLGDVQVLAFSPSGDQLATGSASLNARMWLWSWRLGGGRDLQPVDASSSYADCLAFSPDGQALVSAAGSSIFVWAISDGQTRKRTVVKSNSGDDIKVALFSPDSKRLVGGDSRGQIHFWTMRWLGGRPGDSLSSTHGSISSLAFSPDGLLLASAGLDQRIQIWDGAGSSAEPKAVLGKLRGVVRRMMFLPDSQFLLTAGDGGQVILWNWLHGAPQHEWRLDKALIYSQAISDDGSFVATGASDGTVTLFDLVPD